MAGCPLDCSGGASSWAGSVESVAEAWLEASLGSVSDRFLAELASSGISDYPDVWTDGSHVVDELSGVGVGGCGVYSLRSGAGWFGR